MKKKAFTLTELLVVVIILGVLATVAVPKFSRVLETRRTTEAENMLSAVRTEQEARCTMGKPYWGPQQEGQVQVLAKAGVSPNYNYELLANGINAQRPGKYTLRMWYKTGEICCEGEGCSELNKSYPACGEAPADECVGGIQPSVPDIPQSCGEEPADSGMTQSCGECGFRVKSYVCNASTSWTWQAQWSSCQETAKPGDVGTTKACTCGGTQTKDYQCVNNAWSAVWSDCTGGGGECEPGDTQTKHWGPVGSPAVKERSCSDSCVWGDWGDPYCPNGSLTSEGYCCNGTSEPYSNSHCWQLVKTQTTGNKEVWGYGWIEPTCDTTVMERFCTTAEDIGKTYECISAPRRVGDTNASGYGHCNVPTIIVKCKVEAKQ